MAPGGWTWPLRSAPREHAGRGDCGQKRPLCLPTLPRLPRSSAEAGSCPPLPGPVAPCVPMQRQGARTRVCDLAAHRLPPGRAWCGPGISRSADPPLSSRQRLSLLSSKSQPGQPPTRVGPYFLSAVDNNRPLISCPKLGSPVKLKESCLEANNIIIALTPRLQCNRPFYASGLPGTRRGPSAPLCL